MAIPNIFQKEISEKIISRINQLTPNSPRLWGKMNVAQMLAHCNVTYDLVYTDKYPKPGFFMKLILKSLVKNTVTGEKMYAKNLKTGPQFLVSDERQFEDEKIKLIDNIRKTQELGADWFEGRKSHSFGELRANEWNNMFYKHLDHHLSQFGV